MCGAIARGSASLLLEAVARVTTHVCLLVASAMVAAGCALIGGGSLAPTGTLECCEPPAAYALAHGAAAKMYIGTYTWGDCRNVSEGKCVVSDTFQVATSDRAFAVRAGERITVPNPVRGHAIGEAGVSIVAVDGRKPQHFAKGGGFREGTLVWPFGPGAGPGAQLKANALKFEAPSVPGRYVVQLWLSYRGKGKYGAPDVNYALLIEVR
jgi:hypothetical protein